MDILIIIFAIYLALLAIDTSSAIMTNDDDLLFMHIVTPKCIHNLVKKYIDKMIDK